MTSVRQSFIFSLEGPDNLGKGKGDSYAWIAPPPGSYFDSTNTRNTTRIQTTGSKTWDAFAYGKLEGTWNWSFILDYNYLEPLFLVFDGATPSTGTPEDADPPRYYTYTFEKANNSRVPSFCVRRVVLNRMAGGLRSSDGGLDEIVTLKGCVCTSITIARAAGQSQYTVNMNGFYMDESMELGNFERTDYQPYSGNLTEYSCLFIDGTGEDNYVANTETLSIKIDNAASALFNVCSPFAKEYVEGLSDYTFSTTAYANDPSHYQQRVYSGGVDNTDTKPRSKGMAPINDMYILSYNQEVNTEYPTHAAAFGASTKRMEVHIEKCVIKSLQWKSGNSEKLQDSISSAECKKISISFRSPVSDFSFTIDDANALPNIVGRIAATNVTVTPVALALGIGQVALLRATLTPTDCTDPVVWTSTNTAKVTVSSTGVVTAVGAGSAIVRATAGTESATCSVTVS